MIFYTRCTISPLAIIPHLKNHILVFWIGNRRHFKLTQRQRRQDCLFLLIVARQSSNKMKMTKSVLTLHELP